MSVDIDKVRREQVRWILLLALNHARPQSAAEALLLGVVHGVYPDASPLEIRREMDYLENRRLITIDRQPSGPWRAELTRLGVDIVEYTVDCEPGVARPAKYW
jgi:hypothetical protein